MLKIDFKKIFKRNTRLEYGNSAAAWPINHQRDWKILVVVFAVCFILLSVFAWYIYIGDKIAGGFLPQTLPSTETSARTIDQKRLKASVLIMETKRASFQTLRSGRPKTIDPSL